MIDPTHLTGSWEEIHSNERLPGAVWELHSGGRFSARFLLPHPGDWRSFLRHQAVKEWFGEWRVLDSDGYAQGIRLLATDIDSPFGNTLGAFDSLKPLTSILGGVDRDRVKMKNCAKLTRDAHIFRISPDQMRLEWRAPDQSHVTCMWKRLP
ncbi:MAG: hypothetical protein ACRDT0_08840 [Pseudonocardiaceae bacterium]